MLYPDSPYTANMTDSQRVWFYTAYDSARKDEVAGIVLAIFLGAFGAHHFYLRRNNLGILYALFFWTGITGILGLIEAFLMPQRVRDYNIAQATLIAATIRAQPAPPSAMPSAGLDV